MDAFSYTAVRSIEDEIDTSTKTVDGVWRGLYRRISFLRNPQIGFPRIPHPLSNFLRAAHWCFLENSIQTLLRKPILWNNLLEMRMPNGNQYRPPHIPNPNPPSNSIWSLSFLLERHVTLGRLCRKNPSAC